MSVRSPVSFCIICRNDESTLEACLLSIRPYVEEIVVIDTGSTDRSPEIAKKYADIFEVYVGCNNPETGLIEDFSNARNYSLSKSTKPLQAWADADDVLVGLENLPKYVKQWEQNNSAAFLFQYEYAYDENGECVCLHYRERLFPKGSVHFVGPVHEVAVPNDNATLTFITSDDTIYKHKRQYSGKLCEPGRNLRILRAYYEKYGDADARTLYYIGLETCNAGLIDEAIQHLTKYIDVSGWDDEKAMAALKLIDIYLVRGDYQSGLKWAFKTVELKETWGEGYFALGRIFYFLAQTPPNEQRNWERCAHFIKIGLSQPLTKTLLFVNPLDREYDIHRYYNIALNKLGDIKGAIESTNIGLQKRPDDANLLSNKKFYEIFVAGQQIALAADKLKEIGYIDQSTSELIIALANKQVAAKENVPELPAKQEMVVQECIGSCAIMPVETVEQLAKYSTNGAKLDIIFFAGDGLEEWDGNSNNLGGSETMMIQLSQRLAAKQHRVRIYNSCKHEGLVNSVEYYKTEKFQNFSCDVLIISRQAAYLDDRFNISAKLKLLWVHDTCALGATNALLLKADRILALSDWHKQNLIDAHTIHSDHIIKTRNGIDLTLFNKKVIRNKYKCINSSSPDRSWPVLLQVWPEIKKRVPKAELHLFYSFFNWKKIAKYYPGQPELIQQLEQQIVSMKHLDVIDHGRVSQEQLIEEMLSSSVLLYPSWFSETSYLGGMQAQAAGLRFVGSNLAAVKETVGSRGILLDGDWTSKEYCDKFVDAAVTALSIDDNTDREFVQNYAKKTFCIDTLAQEWEFMFYQLIEELKTNPLIPYQPTYKYR